MFIYIWLRVLVELSKVELTLENYCRSYNKSKIKVAAKVAQDTLQNEKQSLNVTCLKSVLPFKGNLQS